MNVNNMLTAIDIMNRAGKFDISVWQEVVPGGYKDTECELHRCGTSACFAGWVAVSPEFRKDGGSISRSCGYPIITDGNNNRLYEASAIAYWLDIPNRDAEDLCFVGSNIGRFYNDKEYDEITTDDVVCVLATLLLEHAGDDTYCFDSNDPNVLDGDDDGVGMA